MHNFLTKRNTENRPLKNKRYCYCKAEGETEKNKSLKTPLVPQLLQLCGFSNGNTALFL